jgi:hypothetical protein
MLFLAQIINWFVMISETDRSILKIIIKILKLSKLEVLTKFLISNDLMIRITMKRLLHGKQPLETSMKIWTRSNYRIKSYEHFELLFWSSITKSHFRPKPVPLVHKYICEAMHVIFSDKSSLDYNRPTLNFLESPTTTWIIIFKDFIQVYFWIYKLDRDNFNS